MNKITLLLLFIMMFFGTSAQDNFTFSPKYPKAGDVVKISYEPSGILKEKENIEAVVYLYRTWPSGDDLVLTRKGNKYEGEIVTDTAVNFLQVGFRSGNIFDNNQGKGYLIHLWNGDKICRGSYASLGNFHLWGCQKTGVEASPEKALEAFEQERSLYPGINGSWEWNYYPLLKKYREDQYEEDIMKEIKSVRMNDLVTEKNYNRLISLYRLAGLTSKGDSLTALKKNKFPDGDWKKFEIMDGVDTIADSQEKIQMAADIISKIQNDEAWKKLNDASMVGSYRQYWKYKEKYRMMILQEYVKNKQWDLLAAIKPFLEDGILYTVIYNDVAWSLQEGNMNLETASGFSQWCVETAKNEVLSPVLSKPEILTENEWLKERESTYASYADTYAMVLYKMGQYEKGFQYAREAAIGINKGQNPDLNNTWTLLAEKVLPASDLKPRLEQFVKDAKATGTVRDILKKLYVAEHNTEDGYTAYLGDLKKEFLLKKREEIRKTMISETAPVFTLLDLNDKKVDLSELKGKVVIIDFWATWCGPCKASLPYMQQEVEKYKDQKDVVFLFVDSWEKGDNAARVSRVSEFLKAQNYSFTVLMDHENSVIKSYKVDGIPTKFIVDKNGMIRFRTVGFGDGPGLQTDLEVMIGLLE